MSERKRVAGEPKVPRICRQIKLARQAAGISQRELADRMKVVQSRVSAWETDSEPRLDVLAKIESVLRLSRGELLRAAGYVDGVISVGRAIEEDPLLDARGRKVLLAAYRALHPARVNGRARVGARS